MKLGGADHLKQHISTPVGQLSLNLRIRSRLQESCDGNAGHPGFHKYPPDNDFTLENHKSQFKWDLLDRIGSGKIMPTVSLKLCLNLVKFAASSTMSI